MRDAVIVDAVRTPVGKRKGALSSLHPAALSALVLNALAERNAIDPAVVDDVVWGCVAQAGEQTMDIARNAVLSAGWPLSVPGTTVDRQCGSSQQSVHFAAAGLIAGQYDVVVAGGVESMSRVPMMNVVGQSNPFGPALDSRLGGVPPHQGIGAETIAERWGLSRTELDEFSLASHEKAAAAQDAGRFAGQIVPVNPAAAVRGPKHVVKTGKTPVLDGKEWRKLIDTIPTYTLRDLRDRALAAASYLRRPGDSQFRAFKLDVLRAEAHLIAEITTFNPDLFPAFGLSLTL